MSNHQERTAPLTEKELAALDVRVKQLYRTALDTRSACILGHSGVVAAEQKGPAAAATGSKIGRQNTHG